jgi:hypothetical protein
MTKLLIGMLATVAPAAAIAGPLTPLGAPLGVPLGLTTLGTALPIAGGGLLVVAATGLVIGIRIARRKRK